MFGGLRVGTPGVVFYFVSVLCERALVLRRCKDNENLRIKQAFHVKIPQKNAPFPPLFLCRPPAVSPAVLLVVLPSVVLLPSPFLPSAPLAFLLPFHGLFSTAPHAAHGAYIRTGGYVYTYRRTRIYVRADGYMGGRREGVFLDYQKSFIIISFFKNKKTPKLFKSL